MLTPLPGTNWNYELAAHLLGRAGFGGTPDEIISVQNRGLIGAVDFLLQPPDDSLRTDGRRWSVPADFLAGREKDKLLQTNPVEKAKNDGEIRKHQNEDLSDLRAWWLARMKNTRAPLIEKMTLFWHGHFATSAQKVPATYLLWRQNQMFREHSLGNFTTLLKAVSRDPAMMHYLDLQESQKAHPNENWAREAMELFSLGIGNYTEQDVRESARAFTGYRIDEKTLQFNFSYAQHDPNTKWFLGRVGNFFGDDIIDIIAAQPACPRFLACKLWRFFVADDPPNDSVESVAATLRRHNLEIAPALREIFLSAEFYAAEMRGAQVKSPVQFLVQTCKLLGIDLPPIKVCENALRSMGQMLFEPPNVKGWDGGKAWVSTSTLLFRINFTNFLLEGAQNGAPPPVKTPPAPLDLARILPLETRWDATRLVDSLSFRFFGAEAPAKEEASFLAYLQGRELLPTDQTIRSLLHLMMSTPRFQLT